MKAALDARGDPSLVIIGRTGTQAAALRLQALTMRCARQSL